MSTPATTMLIGHMQEPPPLTADMFLPAPAAAASSEAITRPTLTYWQDALMRLRRDRLAIACVTLIAVVAAIGIIGPLFFPAPVDGVPYENVQDANGIDQSPTLGNAMTVVDEAPPMAEDLVVADYDLAAALQDHATLRPPADFGVLGVPTANGITMRWQAEPGVSGYQVFRQPLAEGTYEPEALRLGTTERGIVVGEIINPAQHSYTDTLGLDPDERYAYSIVSFIDDPQTGQRHLSAEAAVLETGLQRTIPLAEALAIDPNALVGSVIRGQTFLFGTDGLGRDVLARMVMGTRVDMLLALFVPFVSILVGLIYGSISGLAGKKTDLIMMRVVEVVDNFPDLLFFILLQVAIGKGLFSLFIAMTLFWWAGFARIVRGEVLRLREIEFVQASRLLGGSVMHIVRKHLGPNLLGLVIIAWSARIPSVIAFETFLSMLGLGLEQPTPSWGNVVFDAARRLQVNPLQFFLPTVVLGVTLLAFYLLGNSLRDAFDPNLRGRS